MEEIMRAFLWNQNGQHRTHWVSWERIVTPLEKGGLGIRKISETMYGLHGKLAWNIFSGESIWAQLLYQKYGLNGVHVFQPARPNSSRLWKVLCPRFRNLRYMSRWRVGSGQILFWQMNWMGEVLDAASDSLMTVCQGLENLDSLQHQITANQMIKIKEVCVLPTSQDKLIFTPSRDGWFNIKAYLGQIIVVRPNQNWTNIVWNQLMTPRVNAFMWRLYQGAFPLDENIQAKGITLASKWTCCVRRKKHYPIFSWNLNWQRRCGNTLVWNSISRSITPQLSSYFVGGSLGVAVERSWVMWRWRLFFTDYGKFGKNDAPWSMKILSVHGLKLITRYMSTYIRGICCTLPSGNQPIGRLTFWRNYGFRWGQSRPRKEDG